MNGRSTVANIVSVLAVATLVAAVSWLIAGWPVGESAQPEPDARVSSEVVVPINDAQVMGQTGASLALIEFSDFQCPYCGEFAREVLPEIRRKYVDPGHLLLVFMHLPLEAIHPVAIAAAEAAECAGRKGLFWQVHQAFFSKQSEISPAGIRRLVGAAGIELNDAFDQCLAGQTRARIADQTALAYTLGIRSTPTLLLGQVNQDHSVRILSRFDGVWLIADLVAEIEKRLPPRHLN